MAAKLPQPDDLHTPETHMIWLSCLTSSLHQLQCNSTEAPVSSNVRRVAAALIVPRPRQLAVLLQQRQCSVLLAALQSQCQLPTKLPVGNVAWQ